MKDIHLAAIALCSTAGIVLCSATAGWVLYGASSINDAKSQSADAIGKAIDKKCTANSLLGVPYVQQDIYDLLPKKPRSADVFIKQPPVLTIGVDGSNPTLTFSYSAVDAVRGKVWTDSYESSICAQPYAVALKKISLTFAK